MTKGSSLFLLVQVNFRSRRTLSAGMASASLTSKKHLLLHRFASFVANKLRNRNLLSAGSSAHAPAAWLSLQKTSAIFPLKSPSSTPIILKFIMFQTDNYKWFKWTYRKKNYYSLLILYSGFIRQSQLLFLGK